MKPNTDEIKNNFLTLIFQSEIFHISAHRLRMFVFVVKVQIQLSTHSWHTECKCEVTLTCENISYLIEQENSIKKDQNLNSRLDSG